MKRYEQMLKDFMQQEMSRDLSPLGALAAAYNGGIAAISIVQESYD